jgi:histidine ammonia-lyase
MTITLRPGRATLADWRAVADGAGVCLDRAAIPAIEAGARTVEAIVARGAPVYGINTGFGKLASVRIGPADLATLNAISSSRTRQAWASRRGHRTCG